MSQYCKDLYITSLKNTFVFNQLSIFEHIFNKIYVGRYLEEYLRKLDKVHYFSI